LEKYFSPQIQAPTSLISLSRLAEIQDFVYDCGGLRSGNGRYDFGDSFTVPCGLLMPQERCRRQGSSDDPNTVQIHPSYGQALVIAAGFGASIDATMGHSCSH
jgi:hypothetical protein